MTELDDHELLAQYVRAESETAFTALVSRYVNLVYSAALRFTGNCHHAEEITQAVFIIFARKANRLPRSVVLSGWLYQTARLTAANFVKSEIRRQNREQEVYMQSTVTEAKSTWEEIAPLLDDAMGELGETDRNAVLLRFFENKSAQQVAATLKMNEGAAQRRVNRAVEKLRKFFVKRGVVSTTTMIAGVVAANSVQAAPVGLAVTISATTVKGAAFAVSITTLVEGTIKLMKYAKLKLALGIAAAILLAGGATTAVISQISGQAKILVKGLFVKVPTKNFAAIMNEFAKPVIPTDPHSRAFRDFIQQHSAVIFLGAPTITTGNGVKANISLTNAVTINGTNANVGITFDVLPTIQSDSNITIKFKAELRELTSGTLPSIHVTKIEEQMKGMHSGLTGAVRAKIGGDGATVGRNQDESETLLISINAAEVK